MSHADDPQTHPGHLYRPGPDRRRGPGGGAEHDQHRHPGRWRPPWPRSSAWPRRAVKWPAWPCRIRRRPRPSAQIKRESPLPLIADIHFNHRLALASLEQGADAIRINPGNLGGAEKTRHRGGGLPGAGRAPAPGGERRLPGGGPPGAVRRAHRRGPGGQRPALGASSSRTGVFLILRFP